jgi:putative Ca2+/H+ antiporter (TMEM165/GDT1 family)
MLGDPTQVAVISVAADDRLEVWGIVSGVVSSASSDMK